MNNVLKGCNFATEASEKLTKGVGNSNIKYDYSMIENPGPTVYTGPVGYQGGVYLGGEDIIQTFIREPWKLKVEVISKTPLK